MLVQNHAISKRTFLFSGQFRVQLIQVKLQLSSNYTHGGYIIQFNGLDSTTAGWKNIQKSQKRDAVKQLENFKQFVFKCARICIGFHNTHADSLVTHSNPGDSWWELDGETDQNKKQIQKVTFSRREN